MATAHGDGESEQEKKENKPSAKRQQQLPTTRRTTSLPAASPLAFVPPPQTIFCNECHAPLDSKNPTRELQLSFCYVCATMYAVVRRSKGLFQAQVQYELEQQKKREQRGGSGQQQQ